MMIIKVRHTDRQLYACAKRAQSDFMEGIYCKKYQWGPESEIELLYPRWPLSAAVSAGIRNFLAEATLVTTDLD